MSNKVVAVAIEERSRDLVVEYLQYHDFSLTLEVCSSFLV